MHSQESLPEEEISRVHPVPEFQTAVHRGSEQTIKSMQIPAAASEQLDQTHPRLRNSYNGD